MKSLKDALTLYRTLAAEALAEFYLSERGQAAGRRLDDVAWRLSTKIRPPRPPRPDFGGFEHVEDLGAYQEVFAQHYKDLADAVADRFDTIFTEGTSDIPDVFAKQAADQRPLSQEWADRLTERLAAREQYAFPQVTLPSFADIELQPWQERMQASVNAMVEKARLAGEGYVFGQVNHPEWIYLDRKALLEVGSVEVGPEHPGTLLGVPLEVDPDNENLARLRAADLLARPDMGRIATALLRFKTDYSEAVRPSE